MSTFKATFSTHPARVTTLKRPLVLGPRTVLTILLGWVALLTSAFFVGLNLS